MKVTISAADTWTDWFHLSTYGISNTEQFIGVSIPLIGVSRTDSYYVITRRIGDIIYIKSNTAQTYDITGIVYYRNI